MQTFSGNAFPANCEYKLGNKSNKSEKNVWGERIVDWTHPGVICYIASFHRYLGSLLLYRHAVLTSQHVTENITWTESCLKVMWLKKIANLWVIPYSVNQRMKLIEYWISWKCQMSGFFLDQNELGFTFRITMCILKYMNRVWSVWASLLSCPVVSHHSGPFSK